MEGGSRVMEVGDGREFGFQESDQWGRGLGGFGLSFLGR